MSLYEDLGVRENATPEEIKAAYRRKAQESHPDKHGGDEAQTERFKVVALAYGVLKDPERRDEYDRTGSTGQADREAEMFNAIIALVMKAIDSSPNPECEDIIANCRNILNMNIAGAKAKQSETRILVRQRRKVAARIKKTGRNIIFEMLTHQIDQVEDSIAKIQQHINDSEGALNVLSEYSFDVKEPDQQGFQTFTYATTSTI